MSVRRLATIAWLLLAVAPAHGNDSKALIDALIRNGVLSVEQAARVEADLARADVHASTGTKPVTRLTLGARLQVQYAGLGTDVASAPDPASTNHFFLRRVYLVTKASFGSHWSLNVTYDAAESLFDAALAQYRRDGFTVDVGLRKAPLGFEELTSSGSLKAIERSAVTRYFVEPNNGRRLGAAGYRVGVFAEKSTGNLFFGAAITNPERVGGSTDAGNATSNRQAFWTHAGLKDLLGQGNGTIGIAAGLLPDQGGRTPGAGADLSLWALYFDVTRGAFQLQGEYLAASVEGGVSATTDASPWGYWLLASYRFDPRWEGVIRYSALDTDGRGVNLADSIRSAPGGGTMDRLEEVFVGANWYILGNDLKWQFGGVWGRSEGATAGTTALEATTRGVRSQLQVNF